MSFLYSCASNNIRAHSKQRTPVGMKTLLCNELVYIEDFLKVEEIEARLLTALGTEQKKKKIIFFETCSTIWNIRYQDSVWLYTDPSIGQDMTNTRLILHASHGFSKNFSSPPSGYTSSLHLDLHPLSFSIPCFHETQTLLHK